MIAVSLSRPPLLKCLLLLAMLAAATGTTSDAAHAEETAAQPPAAPTAIRARAWAAAGPVWNANGGAEIGARISLGGDLLMGEEHGWILGAQLAFPYTNERSIGKGAGRVTRLTYHLAPGHAIVPDLLYLQALVGLSVISGESPSFYWKLKPTLGASLSLLQVVPGRLKWGVSLTYERTGEAKDSVASAGATLGCGLFGGAADEDCTSTGVAASRDMLALNLMIGFGN